MSNIEDNTTPVVVANTTLNNNPMSAVEVDGVNQFRLTTGNITIVQLKPKGRIVWEEPPYPVIVDGTKVTIYPFIKRERRKNIIWRCRGHTVTKRAVVISFEKRRHRIVSYWGFDRWQWVVLIIIIIIITFFSKNWIVVIITNTISLFISYSSHIKIQR